MPTARNESYIPGTLGVGRGVGVVIEPSIKVKQIQIIIMNVIIKVVLTCRHTSYTNILSSQNTMLKRRKSFPPNSDSVFEFNVVSML